MPFLLQVVTFPVWFFGVITAFNLKPFSNQVLLPPYTFADWLMTPRERAGESQEAMGHRKGKLLSDWYDCVDTASELFELSKCWKVIHSLTELIYELFVEPSLWGSPICCYAFAKGEHISILLMQHPAQESIQQYRQLLSTKVPLLFHMALFVKTLHQTTREDSPVLFPN